MREKSKFFKQTVEKTVTENKELTGEEGGIEKRPKATYKCNKHQHPQGAPRVSVHAVRAENKKKSLQKGEFFW